MSLKQCDSEIFLHSLTSFFSLQLKGHVINTLFCLVAGHRTSLD